MLLITFMLFIIASLLGAFLPNVRWGSRISCILSSIASIILLYASAKALLGSPIRQTIFSGPASIPLELDGLSALFLLIFSIPYTLTSIYSIKYIEDEYVNAGIDVRRHSICFPIFLMSMVGAILVRSGLWLIVFWELMSLTSYFLITIEHEKEEVRDAGFVYFIMSHIAAALLIVTIISLASWTHPLSFTYSSLRDAYHRSPLPALIGLPIIFTVAMWIKGGIVPVHFWLPRAYPAAPSNVSALFAGVMEKVPIFLLTYFTFRIFDPTIPSGLLICIPGIISMVIGCLYAIPQRDDKALLAYSTIGQIGYIWFALGAGIILYSYSKSLALLAIILISSGLFHLLNHSLFKPMLFMITGNVLVKAKSRDMDVLGGLGRTMPITSIACLIGCLSLIGLPPFNGFASKWSIYVSGIASSTVNMISIPIYVGVALAMFSGTLTAIYSLKFYSEIFSGEPRIDVEAGDVSAILLIPELTLGILCIILGVFPGVAFSAIFPAVQPMIPEVGLAQLFKGVGFLYSILMIPTMLPLSTMYFILLATIAPIIFVIAYQLAHPKRTSVQPTWLGGFRHTLRDTKLVAASFYSEFESMLGSFYQIRIRRPRIAYPEPNADLVLVKPWIWIGRAIGELRRIQVGPVQIYVAILLILLISFLLMVVIG